MTEEFWAEIDRLRQEQTEFFEYGPPSDVHGGRTITTLTTGCYTRVDAQWGATPGLWFAAWRSSPDYTGSSRAEAREKALAAFREKWPDLTQVDPPAHLPGGEVL